MNFKDDPELIKLKKSLPDSRTFFKNLENSMLNEFDKYNDNFLIVTKFSKEYYLLREFITKTIVGSTIRAGYFRKKRLKIYRKIRNYKNYLRNEIESAKENIEGIS